MTDRKRSAKEFAFICFDITVDVCVGWLLLTRLYDERCAVLELAKLTKQQKAYQRDKEIIETDFLFFKKGIIDKEEKVLASLLI